MHAPRLWFGHGLFTRFVALPLLGMTIVIKNFVYPPNWSVHLIWLAMLYFLPICGSGAISFAHLLGPTVSRSLAFLARPARLAALGAVVRAAFMGFQLAHFAGL